MYVPRREKGRHTDALRAARPVPGGHLRHARAPAVRRGAGGRSAVCEGRRSPGPGCDRQQAGRRTARGQPGRERRISLPGHAARAGHALRNYSGRPDPAVLAGGAGCAPAGLPAWAGALAHPVGSGRGPRPSGRFGRGPRPSGRSGRGPRPSGRFGRGPRPSRRSSRRPRQGRPPRAQLLRRDRVAPAPRPPGRRRPAAQPGRPRAWRPASGRDTGRAWLPAGCARCRGRNLTRCRAIRCRPPCSPRSS